MFEKVNPSHPDKIADRIAGAIVDLAYKKNYMPKIAVEVLIGHNHCHVITETSEHFTKAEIKAIIRRLAGNVKVDYKTRIWLKIKTTALSVAITEYLRVFRLPKNKKGLNL